uniref:Uncharacterized protein n=1 Tax=Magallana gigas TaxID=29159 RepID=A0A8W8NQV7_MAGGI
MPPRRPPQALPATPAPPTPRAPTRSFNPQLCPALMCPDMPRNVPESCLRPGVIMGMNGQECPGCPQVDPGLSTRTVGYLCYQYDTCKEYSKSSINDVAR